MSVARWLAVLGSILLMTGNAKAEVLENVSIDYANGTAIVDFSSLAERFDIRFVRLTRCSAAPVGTVPCAPQGSSRLVPSEGTRVVIDEIGLYLVELFVRSPYTGSTFARTRAWKQYVANLHRPDETLVRAAARHVPQYSFNDEEREFFPLSVDTLFDRTFADFRIAYHGGPISELHRVPNRPTDSVVRYLSTNGHADALATMTYNENEATRGSSRDFPVYWFVDRLSETRAIIHYVTFFSYDDKLPEFIANGDAIASLGDHTLDRESVALTLSRNSSGAWQPVDVVYAGHLPTQRTFFLGCSDPVSVTCDGPGEPLVSWLGGGTRVAWERAARVADQPLVSVARGSHAMTPATGYYALNVIGDDSEDATVAIGQIGDVIGEPAGERIDLPREPTRLVALDLSDPAQSMLTYSGSLIRGALGRDWNRLFPFVRYPSAPWVEGLGRGFESCLIEERGCATYVRRISVAEDSPPDETDTDGDGVPDRDDDFPDDPLFDSDRDGDGVPDERDAFPDDPTETADLDGDGRGDNANPVPGLSVIEGIVTDGSDNTPVSGALLRVEIFQSAFARDGIVQTRSGPDGRFRLPIELSALPGSFALTATASGYVPRAVAFPSTLDRGSPSVERDIELERASSTVVAIEPEPVVHHLGDDFFEGAENSQFQRASEGVAYERRFTLTAEQAARASFRFTVLAKGVQNYGNFLLFNGDERVDLSATADDGDFSVLVLDGATTSQYLVEGVNTLAIVSGFDRDYDDFEFANPLIRFDPD